VLLRGQSTPSRYLPGNSEYYRIRETRFGLFRQFLEKFGESVNFAENSAPVCTKESNQILLSISSVCVRIGILSKFTLSLLRKSCRKESPLLRFFSKKILMRTNRISVEQPITSRIRYRFRTQFGKPKAPNFKPSSKKIIVKPLGPYCFAEFYLKQHGILKPKMGT